MSEVKTFYHIGNLDLGEINRTLAMIADRIDKLEGLRGTPRFYNEINAGNNKITAVAEATQAKEALTYDYTDKLGEAAFKDIGTNSDTVAAGDTGVTNGDDHDHSGGDGAQIDHSTTSNLTTGNPHTQYLLLAGNQTITGTIKIGDEPNGDYIEISKDNIIIYVDNEITHKIGIE